MYVVIDTDGRVKCTSEEPGLDGAVAMAVPEGFSQETQFDWRMEGGVLVHAPLPRVDIAPISVDDLAGCLIDVEYRLILMEMGVMV